jgi:hypothetical protein
MRGTLLLVACLLAAALVAAVALLARSERANEPSSGPAFDAHDSARAPTTPEKLLTPEVDEPQEAPRANVSAEPSKLPRNPSATIADTAFITVHVAAMEDGHPIDGAQVELNVANTDFFSTTEVVGNEGKAGNTVTADRDGIARFVAAARTLHTVFAYGSRRSEGIRPSHEWKSVEPLDVGESVTIDIRLRTRPDTSFFGRIIAAENGEPLVDGTIELVNSDYGHLGRTGSVHAVPREIRGDARSPSEELKRFTTARSDATGHFELGTAAWIDQMAYAVRIDVPGRSLLVVPLTAGHSTIDTALVVPLTRSAIVVARVVSGAGVPQDHVIVRITHRDAPRQKPAFKSSYSPPVPTWERTTDRNGSCRIDDLPSGVPLAIELSLGDRIDRHFDPPLVLQDGEDRELELRFGGRAGVRGLLLDSTNAPLADEVVWIERSDHHRRERFEPNDTFFAEARTDASGRFSFDDVSPGDWFVGPAARAMTLPSRQIAGVLAPIAVPVLVPSNGMVDVVLHTARGLTIRGQVMDASKQPIGYASIQASSVDTPFAVSATGNADGTFLLGPLVAGEYEITATPSRVTFETLSDHDGARPALAPCAPVRANAGDQSVRLVLRLGGSIRCSLDWREVAVRPEDLAELHIEIADADGRPVEWNGAGASGLKPGRYSAFAWSANGSCVGRSGIDVRSGETSDVALTLHKGARVRVKCDVVARETDRYQLWCDDVCCASVVIEAIGVREHIVPVGHVVIRKHSDAAGWTEDAIDIRDDETRELTLER